MNVQLRLLADGFVFGEGPRWRGDRLWFSDMHGEAVYTVDCNGNVETVVELPGRRPSGLGFLPDGSLLIVSMLEPEILHWNGSDLRVHADLRGLVPDPCNDMVVDKGGNAYVGSFPPYTDPKGVIVLVEPDGSARIVAEDVRFPNGSVVTTDGRTMIVAESLGRRFTRFRIAPDGSLTERAEFADCSPDGPDGICLDLDGALWAAFPLAHEFRRIAPGGKVLNRINMGERLAIACTLGGTELRTLFLLSSLALPGDAIQGTRDAAIHIVEVDTRGAGSP
ncbi:MAG: SMP-30/gluconolactonase/LRE family protein [Actinomycetota bacterium]|nr:SMP-30/gluconolactonase/LRE family protein [Actinomycetota bacterium]